MTTNFARTVWSTLQDGAASRGIRLTAVVGGYLDEQNGSRSPARRVYHHLDKQNFDGVLVFTGALGTFSDQADAEAFVRGLRPLPVVSIGVPVEGVPSLCLDQSGPVEELVRHLHSVHGFRRFAFLEGPPGQPEARARRAAFSAALGRLGVPEEDKVYFSGDFTKASGAAALKSLIDQAGGPTALVCVNDLSALGALEAAREAGVTVPGTIAITGFDDLALAVFQGPSLTSVPQPLIRQSLMALDLLVAAMDGDDSTPAVVLPALVRYRESCGCTPRMTPFAPADKAAFLRDILGDQAQFTPGFLAFAREWVSDFLTSFEYFLDTDNRSVLKSLWGRYYRNPELLQGQGVSFRRLFLGLESLFGSHPRFEQVQRENLLLAGGAEARKGVLTEQTTRQFFYSLNAVETALGRVQSREDLRALSETAWAELGVEGVALVRFGAPPQLVYQSTRWTERTLGVQPVSVDYPALLPPVLVTDDQHAHRVVEALTTDETYLGYAVFWTNRVDVVACDLLARQFSGALQRIELLERIDLQSSALQASLDEARRMQQQLVETEKVASLGRLVAGVAHEINTPLGTGITGASYLLDRLGDVRRQFEAGTLARSVLEQFFAQGDEALTGVLRNLMKAGELVQAFKSLGLDHTQGEWKPIELRTLFGDLGTLYQAECLKKGIELRCEFPAAGLHVFSQPSALVQVVGELLENAMEHAFPTGFPEPQVLLQVGVDDTNLRLAVTDNGRGLSADERRHLFDPLFTTLRAQGHAGLGLHLVFQLVNRTLGGSISVASEPGAGSCFLCVIPLKTP